MSAPDLSNEQIEKLLHGISIPPQPQIMVDLQMEQAKSDCSIDRMADLISHDVGLSGSILKTVNSPFFGLKNKITSINQAITLLGIKSVVNIVNALSIRGCLSDDEIISLGRFWDSAMDIAMACTTIAKQVGYRAPDEAYTLGLFHNCGIPLLMQRFDNFSQVMEEAYGNAANQRVIDTENALVKTNHAVVGYYVAKSWNLPRYLSDAIANHHNVANLIADGTADEKTLQLVAILKIAEHLCGNYRMLGNQPEDLEWLNLQDTVLEFLELNPDDLQSLKDVIEELGLGGTDYLQL